MCCQACSVPRCIAKDKHINHDSIHEQIRSFGPGRRLLQLLVAVVEAGTITGAAQRLGVTQSAVSHLLDKLRAITGDPLFVKSGRGIVATARAEALAAQARELLASWSGSRARASSTRHAGRPPSPLRPTTSSATCCCPP